MYDCMDQVALRLDALGASYAYPEAEAILPRIVWRESENRVFARADGEEALTRETFTVSIWAREIGEAKRLAARVDGEMSATGLNREAMHSLYEASLPAYRLELRYTGLVDAGGTVWQG